MNIRDLITQLGGNVVAEACGVTQPAVVKWKHGNRLPMTEFTGRTQYHQRIADLAGVEAAEVLEASRRGWQEQVAA